MTYTEGGHGSRVPAVTYTEGCHGSVFLPRDPWRCRLVQQTGSSDEGSRAPRETQQVRTRVQPREVSHEDGESLRSLPGCVFQLPERIAIAEKTVHCLAVVQRGGSDSDELVPVLSRDRRGHHRHAQSSVCDCLVDEWANQRLRWERVSHLSVPLTAPCTKRPFPFLEPTERQLIWVPRIGYSTAERGSLIRLRRGRW